MNRRRGLVVAAGLALSVLLVVGRCVQVMMLQHDYWADRARRQQEQVIKAPAPRGRIVSADGYVLATSVGRFAIQLDTKAVVYPGLFAETAAPLLGEPAGELERRLERGSRSVWLAQRVPPELGEQVRALADTLEGNPGSMLLQYTYGLASPPFAAPSPRFAWTRVAMVARNLPPATIWRLDHA